VTNAKISDGTIAPIKLDGTGVTTGYVLTKTAGAVAWGAVGGGLTLPYTNSISSSSTLFDITNSGTGKTSVFQTNNGTNTDTTVSVITNHSSSSLSIKNTNTNNTHDVLSVVGSGTGGIGYFSATSSSNTNTTVEAINSSQVSGISPSSGVGGVFGLVNNTSAGAYSAGVRGVSLSTNSSGYGTVGTHAGSGVGVYGQSSSGKGVEGISGGTGVYGNGTGTSSIGVEAEYSGSTASGIALQVNNGYMKVAGAKKTAFQHQTTQANVNGNTTLINYPGMAATDILFVTHRMITVTIIGGFGVSWNGQAWVIFNENAAVNMPLGEIFNILVIKQ